MNDTQANVKFDADRYYTVERYEDIEAGLASFKGPVSSYAYGALMPSGYYLVNMQSDYAIRFSTQDALASYVESTRDDVMSEPLSDHEIIVVIEPLVVHPDDII